jgi:CRP-like cAMP-binding protein
LGAELSEGKWAVGDLLSRDALFAGLSAAKLRALIGASRILEFAPHEFLYRAGEPVRDAHLLVSGTVKRAMLLSGDSEKIVELVQSSQLLGLGEIFGDAGYGASCEAVTHCIVIAIELRQLRAMVREDLDLSWRVIQAMAHRQYAIEFDVTAFRQGVIGTQRVLDYLVELAGGHPGLAGETTVTLKTSKKMIAAQIGITAESFSRSLRLLSENGVIVVEGRKVHIQNAALLDTQVGNPGQRLSFSRKTKSTGGQAGKTLSPGALVNLCGRTRMLAQQMAMDWAMLGQNIAPSKAERGLRRSTMQFEQTLEQLAELDPSHALGESLARVMDLWPPYRDALFSAEAPLAKADAVLELSEEILAALDRLTREAESHANPPVPPYVNIAGRNRMLSQRIGKLFLFREWGVSVATIRQRMSDSFSEFEANLAELKRSGVAVPELAAQLDEVEALWRKFAGVLHPDVTYASKERHALAVLAEGERLLRNVDTAVKLYERLAS